MKVTKEQRSYRPKACTVKLIEVLAEKLGLKSQADVIDQWADEWVEKNGCPEGFGEWQWSEKKSGARPGVFRKLAGETIEEDVPDFVESVKVSGPEGVKRLEAERPDLKKLGVKRGSELKAPVGKKPESVGLPGQVLDLATGRVGRAPLKRPGEK